MQDRIKELAIEAGAKPFSGYLNNKPDMEFLERFAQAIARECAEIATEAEPQSGIRHEIYARFGLATPPGDG